MLVAMTPMERGGPCGMPAQGLRSRTATPALPAGVIPARACFPLSKTRKLDHMVSESGAPEGAFRSLMAGGAQAHHTQ